MSLAGDFANTPFAASRASPVNVYSAISLIPARVLKNCPSSQ
eukprot:gene227-8911_t